MQLKSMTIALALVCIHILPGTAQTVSDSSVFYNQVRTYVNPVLPGDHPDPTLLKVGDDFYHCGSSFHFTPYLPVYHSRDLVHWELISRVVQPGAAARISDRPSAGIWQGAITYFYGSYWIYFSSGGQWFTKASSPYGPWSAPVHVETNPATGNLGYDNSIFIDDGKPYMVIKNGQKVNRIQALGRDGQLTDSVINLDWVNTKLQYSWAEGPVMSKRNGFYYYFPAGDVSGGQYVLRGTALTGDSTKWERLGEFFKPVTDPNTGFRRPNHISAPFQLADGRWWTIGQSYEKHADDDWSGMGRQSLLFEVIWEGDRPWGVAPTTSPLLTPGLPKSGILWRSVQSDFFGHDTLNLAWHFLNQKSSKKYSLTDRKGWIRLSTDTARTHLVQKETDHYYSAVTKVDLNATDTASKAGIYLTNGNQRSFVRLYTGFDGGKKIIFGFDTAKRVVSNTAGNIVWLKIERYEHDLTAFFSRDGKQWTQVGAPINVRNLDKVQPNYNSWVGTSVGLFAESSTADFDFFVCKDGLSTMPAIGHSNYFGVKQVNQVSDMAVTNNSANGGWFMISGVEMGDLQNLVRQIELTAFAKTKTKLEIWIDDLATGRLIGTVAVSPSKQFKWSTLKSTVTPVSGRHDIYVKFAPGVLESVTIKSLRFMR